MKINTTVSSLIFIMFLVPTLVAQDTDKLSNDIQNLDLVKKFGFKITQTEILEDGLIHAKAIANIRHLDLYLSKDYKTLIIGDGFKTETQKKIFFKTDMNLFEKDASFKIGSGKKKVYLFIDPECPYCKRMEKQLSVYFKDATFYVYLFNLSFHKKAIPMSRYVLAKRTDEEKWKALEEIANNGNKFETWRYTSKEIEKYDKHFQNVTKITNELGVTGTPTLLDEVGQRINLDMIKIQQ